MGPDSIAVTSANRILSFNRTSPGATTAMMVTGLQTGENIVGIDTRPADGNLYALTNAGRMYLINAATGAATVRSQLMADPSDTTSPYNGLNGASFGTNFNPVLDRLRVISSSGQNLNINVDTGTVITDAPLTTGTTGQMRTGISGVAYSANFSSACRTSVSLLDTQNGRLLTSSNLTAGQLNDVGALGFTPGSITAYDIATDSSGTDTAVAILQNAGTTSLYTINLATGATSAPMALGGLNAGESVTGLAISRPTTEPMQAVGNMLALTMSNRLISFNTSSPRRLCTSAQVTGMQNNESLLSIDTRPANGLLYGVSNQNRVYSINPTTGAATQTATLSKANASDPFSGLVGTNFGMQFNPIADQVRLLSDQGQNIRINVDNGQVSTDTSLNPQGFTVSTLSYTNGFAGATSILAYVLDSAGDQLLSLGASSGSAGNGDLKAIGPLNIGDTGAIAALEINGVNNTAWAANNIGQATVSELDSINLQTGAATRVDQIGGGEKIRGLAYTQVPQTTVVASTTDGRIVQFSPATPGNFTNNVAVSGLQGGEALVGLDFRPANGLLYGLTNQGRLYTVNAMTGAATALGPLKADPADTTMPFAGLMGSAFGFDFNPVVDLTRTFSDVEENLRASADTQLVTTDGTLNRGPFSVVAVSYNNSFNPPSVTTLYDIDSQNDVLLTQIPANNGTLTPVGPLGVDVSAIAGFEIIGPSSGFAALSVNNGPSALYTMNLTTGKATLVGTIRTPNTSDRITAFTAPPSPTAPPANYPVFAIVNRTALTTFPLNAPGAASTPRTITGLASGDTILGADFRPATGVLYILTKAGAIYTVDPTTAIATQVAASLQPNPGDPFTALSGTNFGVNFSPVADAIRVVSDTGQNLAINISSNPGGVTTTTPLSFPQPDIVAVGYTSNYVNALSTRAVVLDASTSSVYLVTPTAQGTILPLARLDPNLLFTKQASLDIVGGTDGLALAAVQPTDGVTPQTQSLLYSVSPLTGLGTRIGPIGPNGTQTVSALAIQLR